MKTVLLAMMFLSAAACADLGITRVAPLQPTYYYTPPMRVQMVNQYGQPVGQPVLASPARPVAPQHTAPRIAIKAHRAR